MAYRDLMDSITQPGEASAVGWPAVIAHADMDAFYASVEQLDNPALRGQPVIVGGTGRRGVVSSASYAARRFGVRSAMPTAQARQLCPQGLFVPGRMERYAEISRTIRKVFQSFTPVVEPLSLDEAFLDLSGTERLVGSPLAAGRAIKRKVLEETGLVVSVGIAPVKMAAKILSEMSKPDGLLMVGPEDLEAFLAPLPVERLWGVGRVTLGELTKMELHTVGDLARADPKILAARLGTLGPRLRRLARGLDDRAVVADWQRKSYGEESTFEQDFLPRALELRRAIIAHAEALGRRLRTDTLVARTVTLKAKLARPLGQGRFPLLTRSLTLPRATDDGAAISEAALSLVARLPQEQMIRLIGVQVHQLERSGDAPQMGLFSATAKDMGRRARLNRALDDLTARFGERAVTRGLVRAERATPTDRIK